MATKLEVIEDGLSLLPEKIRTWLNANTAAKIFHIEYMPSSLRTGATQVHIWYTLG